ncbi:MAG: spore coat protein U domain-containing protein, partial [Gammaproteobacteria bacterium]|nr:spore coat protein U domain-containing protein [Gammaproteobacteria bacterium]
QLPFTVNYAIALSTGSSGTYAPRAMTYAGSHLQYNLYTTAQLVTVWGDGSGGTQTVAQQITGACQYQFFNIGFNCSGSQSNTVYGAVPAMQNVVAGAYADNITVTVTF